MQLTVLSNLEQLVGVPSDDTSRETTPAPFRDARDDLDFVSIPRLVSLECRFQRTMGSNMRTSCCKASPRGGSPWSKKCLINVLTPLGSEVGRKGNRRKGRSRAVAQRQHQVRLVVRSATSCPATSEWKGSCGRTSCLELLGATSYQIVNLFGLDGLARPSIVPLGLGGDVVGEVVGGILLFGLAAIFALEAREEAGHFGGRVSCRKIRRMFSFKAKLGRGTWLLLRLVATPGSQL